MFRVSDYIEDELSRGVDVENTNFSVAKHGFCNKQFKKYVENPEAFRTDERGAADRPQEPIFLDEYPGPESDDYDTPW